MTSMQILGYRPDDAAACTLRGGGAVGAPLSGPAPCYQRVTYWSVGYSGGMKSNAPDGSSGAPEPHSSAVDGAAVRIAELLMIKPKWRGWIHTVTAPLALAAGIALVVLAPTADRRITSAVFAATGVLLFGVSAVYHRGNWSPRVKLVLKRLDHTNIMLVIAGTYTPLAWTLLERQQAVVLLWVIWAGAILGVLFRLLWTDAPRWLYVPIYIALGCGALFYLPQFFQASPASAVLICVGGVL